MANIKSAVKRIAIAKRNRAKNLKYKDLIKKAFKKAYKTKSAEDISAAVKSIDKAAQNNVVHKNFASRKKSSLMKLQSTAK